MSWNRAPIEFAAMLRRLVAALALVLSAAHAHTVAAEVPGRFDTAQPPMDRWTEDRVLALDPANISAADVRDVLVGAHPVRLVDTGDSNSFMHGLLPLRRGRQDG